MVFAFGSVYVVNYVYRLAYVEPALQPQDESYLIMMNKLFDVLLQFASILLKTFFFLGRKKEKEKAGERTGVLLYCPGWNAIQK